MKTVAVIGPPGSGKTLIATSLAIYLHLASAKAVFIDKSITKAGASLIKDYVPLAADLDEAADMGARYAVIDAAPYDVPPADVYVVVLEPVDLKHFKQFRQEGIHVVVNKASKWSLRGIPFDSRVHWAMQAGVPPVVAQLKGFERTRKRIIKAIKEIGDAI
ncbi:ATP-binding protein [Pyrobaculum aerophilum]|uniref:Uncharacterized protein n=1 Tax=Pyrobaculum aerophilum TaxID=13773 RepID=A0A371QYK9_9CREN|nr:ATP-binding protein [Pyrobaculum aerophilum]RFA95816.1 hypothetical protein CGL52_12195 [Pyrobaculum aerophilum]RFA96169.1 hypothetical protein CGL51_05750 [Pyrobaculum aerophilum]